MDPRGRGRQEEGSQAKHAIKTRGREALAGSMRKASQRAGDPEPGEGTQAPGKGQPEVEWSQAMLQRNRHLKQAARFVHKDSADLLPLDGLKRLGTSKDLVSPGDVPTWLRVPSPFLPLLFCANIPGNPPALVLTAPTSACGMGRKRHPGRPSARAPHPARKKLP